MASLGGWIRFFGRGQVRIWQRTNPVRGIGYFRLLLGSLHLFAIWGNLVLGQYFKVPRRAQARVP